MTKIVAKYAGGEVINPYLVNRNGNFGKTWLVQVAIANALNPLFVVEAANESDAIDEFIDSEWGGWITLSEEDAADWHEDDVSYGGNEDKLYLPHQIWVARCTVDYGDYLINKDDHTAFENWVFAETDWDEIDSRFRDILIKHWEDISEDFNNDWLEYVEEENTNKSDAEYNANIAGKTYFDE